MSECDDPLLLNERVRSGPFGPSRGAEAELVSQALAAPGADKKKDLSAADEYRLFCEASGKLTLLRNLLPRLISKGHRVLIFSFFKIVSNCVYVRLLDVSRVIPASGARSDRGPD